jgi:surfeit locus 1 family protein
MMETAGGAPRRFAFFGVAVLFRLRPLLWPTLISLPILVLALGLSVWQMERREWKRDILDRIAANQAAAPVALDDLVKGDPLDHEYGRARISGTFLNDKEFYLAARDRKDDVGLQVITPLRADDGRIVLFDRGWIPSEKKDPATRAAGQIAGRVELTGIVRRSQVQRQFAPDNDPAKNFWFHVDVPLMRRMAGGAPDPRLDVFFLEADATPNPGGLPVGGQTGLDIPNDHLQYAITWFLIALALVGVYFTYHWEQGRLTVAGHTKVKA